MVSLCWIVYDAIFTKKKKATNLIYWQQGNSIGIASNHALWVILSVGRWQHMSDIYITYQCEGNLMHKVTYCAQLHPVPDICGYSALQDIKDV